jgi:predicted enzyme related to lactoylglutathione lyase/uncharacterized protein YndB with AHSA1/START domain
MSASAAIVHETVVDAGVETALDIFTTHLGAWWPLAYTFSLDRFRDAAIEPRAGGVWFEIDDAGQRLSWGEVRAFEPGARIVLGFAIGPDRQPAANDAASEVDVRFAHDTPGRTRVTVEHRAFERHGEGGDATRAGMDSPQGWPLILAELRRWIRTRPAVRYIAGDIDAAVAFYTAQLGFTIDMRPAPGFAALSRGPIRLLLNAPGAGGAGAATTDGARPESGGWNRLQIVTTDLTGDVRRIRAAGHAFRGDPIDGNGGRQALLEDPSGNAIELLEPKARRSGGQ